MIMSHYEMRPFRITGRDDHGAFVEQCAPGDADGWSIYERREGQPSVWVSDHASRRGAAVRLAELKAEAGEH